MKTAAIILAAGRSSRFGDGNKLLAMLDGKPLVRHVLDTACQAGLAEIILVTGHMAGPVGEAVAGTDARVIHNPDFADGMASSIRAGVSGLRRDIEAAFLMLGDMPLVRVGTLLHLMDAAHQNPDRQAVIPVESGRRGNPVLFSAAMFPALKALAGDAGARRLLEGMPDQLFEMPCDDAGIHADFDTQGALEGMILSRSPQ